MKTCLARHLLPAVLLGTVLGIYPDNGLATDIVVSGFGDTVNDNDGTCTLREAVRSARDDIAIDGCAQGDGADRILLTAGTYTLDLVNGSDENEALDGDLDLLGPLEIRGVSADYTVITRAGPISKERVFHVFDSSFGLFDSSAGEVVIRNLRVTGGHDSAGGNILNDAESPVDLNDSAPALRLIDVVVENGTAAQGGGIAALNRSVTLLIRTTVRDNNAADGGGIAVIGAGAGLSIVESTLIGNTAVNLGGGLLVSGAGAGILRSRVLRNTAIPDDPAAGQGAGGGIAIEALGTLDAGFTRIDGNRATEGGGVYVTNTAGSVVLEHSALLENEATQRGGGLYAAGDSTIRHSTLAANSASQGAGGGAYSNAATLFDSVTIAGNSGGGVLNDSGVVFQFSLLADNDDGNCLGIAPVAGKLNLDDGNTCHFPADDPDNPQLVNADPLLGPLADNNGPTPTFALLPGSPAIDAISQSDKPDCGRPSPPASSPPDQRGYPRGYPPALVNGRQDFLCDIGAFEAHAPHVVDSMNDEGDSSAEDGRCLTDSNTCTLRAAIQQANSTQGLEEIELPAGTYPLTMLGADEDLAATGDLDLLDAVIIRGAGPGATVIEAQGDRVFDALRGRVFGMLNRPKQHSIRDLTIANGRAGSGGGGGIRIEERPVHLERTILTGNVSEGSGGAVRCESRCDLTVTDSRLIGNRASFGGAIATPVDDAGPVLVERSELSGNTATIGGGALAVVDLVLRNSTISGNHAEGSGQDGRGGGVRMRFGVIENSTIAGNSAAEAAGGVWLRIFGTTRSTLIAGNTNLDGDTQNCGFGSARGMTLFSSGHNLADGNGECAFDRATDLPSADPLLAGLAGNGGLTRTHALLPGSPAIDAGDDTSCPPADQRGFFRPGDGDGDGTVACDIGAFEVLGADLGIAIGDSPDPAVVDENVTYTVTISNNGPGPATGVQVTVSLPPELSFVSVDAGDASCTESDGTLECAVGDLPAGASFETTIMAAAGQSGSVSVSASVTAAEADAVPSDNSASETTTVNAATGGGGGGGSGGGGGGSGGGGGGSGGGASSPLLLAMLGLCSLFGRRFSEPPPIPALFAGRRRSYLSRGTRKNSPASCPARRIGANSGTCSNS